MKNNLKIKVYVVPSSHWDREWYLPFRRYQTRLIRLFDKVLKLLKREDYPNFLMDGQWIVLEDYLEIKPFKKQQIIDLIAKGKLTFGPWYVVPDTFIISGESIIHNLQIGMQFERQYGHQLPIGYTPDSFGLAAQLPQIYSQFGFESAMFTRGRRVKGRETLEITWKSPDGTRIPTIAGSYLRGFGLAVPDVWINIERIATDKEQASKEARRLMAEDNTFTDMKSRLWIAGIDHLEPKENLPELVEYINREIDGAEFILADMETYFREFADEVSSMDPILADGEQRGPYKEHFILGNTLSARMDIKIKNRKIENLLSYIVYPLHALNEKDISYEYFDSKSILEFAWKLLVQNHAHDSICCCSCEEAMTDIENRMDNCLQLAKEVEKEELKRLGKSIKPAVSNGALMVYNPLPFQRTGKISGNVVIPYSISDCFLVDEDGNPVNDAKIKIEFQRRMDIESLKTNEYNELLSDSTRILLGGEKPEDIYTGIHISFNAENVPECGYRCYYFAKSDKVVSAENKSADTYAISSGYESKTLENKVVRVIINEDGTLDIYNKETGKEIQNTHYFEIIEDEGDTYTFSPKGEPVYTKGGKATVTLKDGKANVIHELNLPWGDLRLDSTLELIGDSHLISIRTKIRNGCKDVRIRAVLEYPEASETAIGNTAFDLTERPVYQRNELSPLNIMTMPMRDILLLQFKHDYEAVFSNSVHEYETVCDGNLTIAALTLLRAVGKVYSMNTLTKDESGCGEGVRWWSEKAQMQGEFTMEYGLQGYAGKIDKINVMNEALSFSLPLVPCGIFAEGNAASNQRRCSIDGAVLSTFETDDMHNLILRVFNPSDNESLCTIWMHNHLLSAQKIDLKGSQLDYLPIFDFHTVNISLKSNEIATIKLNRYEV